METEAATGEQVSKLMDAQEQITKYHEFIEQNYYGELISQVRKGENFLIVDFTKISKYDPELSDALLEDPEESLKAAQIAVEQFDLETGSSFNVRVSNLSKSQFMLIRNIRSKDIGHFISIEGLVRQKSDVRPQVTSSRFECPSCGNVISVLQLDKRFKEPSRCGCGRKGRFRLLSKELVDAQGLVLEEASENLEGGEQPKRINIFLKEDLVSPMSDKKTNPGTKLIINGSIKEVPVILRSGGQSTRFDLMVEANYVEPVEEEFGDIEINSEEMEKIRETSSDPKLFEKMESSIAPEIYGHSRIKEALLYQLMAGNRKMRGDGGVTRGDIHILLIGDPGSGKSMMLKRISRVAPKARFISGKGVSGAGLTASVVRDEFLGGWSLEAGALVLANRGIVCIDELDKMSEDDRAAMHEALEGQTVTISKANIQATLRCETTVLAAANPKFGRFDPYGTIAEQIDLPPTLINRFDLIFPIKDVPDESVDDKMATFILNLHQNPVMDEAPIDTRLVRKYIAYAKQNVHPKLTDSAIDEIKRYYLKMRSSGSGEGGVKSIPISARQLEALIRLSEASAKLRLSNKVSKRDAKRAVDILHYSLKQIAFDEETGTIDIDRIATSITATQRSKIVGVREIIAELEGKVGKVIPLEDILGSAEEKGISDSDVEAAIEKLKRSGDIFEPKRGFISRI